MSSKYTNGPFGIGCAGSCGYMSAAPRIGVRPQQVIDTRRAFQKQNVQASKLNAPWLWTSIVPSKQYTYLDAYTQMMIYMGMPIDRITDIRNAIQSIWNGPVDILMNFDQTGPKHDSFYTPLSNQQPYIPDASDLLYWCWAGGLVSQGYLSMMLPMCANALLE